MSIRYSDARVAVTRIAAVALVMVASVSSGCGGDPAPAAKPAAAPRARVAAAPTKAIPRILSVTPATVEISDGRATSGSYSVEYEIDDAGLATEAELVIYAPGVGTVQRMAISPQDRGTVTLDLDSSADFGPTVAFRARCPEGETDWYILGTERPAYGTDTGEGMRLTHVAPDAINLDRAYLATHGEDLAEGSGVGVTLFGPLLTPECTPEATVNGNPVKLWNVIPRQKQINALLQYRDIDNRYVSSRYLEVKLSTRGPGFATVNIARIHFVE